MKRIIVPTGYMGSGSSAITDLIAEYKDCDNKNQKFEYVFLHCPDGLFDLEDKLLLGNNALRSDEAIRSFEKNMKDLYDRKYWWVGNYKSILSENFNDITKKYIDKITEFNFQGFWYTHEKTNNKMFWKLCFNKLIKIMSLNKIKPKKVLKYSDGMRISFIKKDEFYKESSKYIYDVINEISKDDNIILDQLLLPFNLYRVDNYFGDELRVIVVERDPRDVFFLNKYIWQKRNNCIPVPLDVNEFCKFYRNMRESEIITKSNKILRIKFEDLIYQYDKTIDKIEKFMGFTKKDHVKPLSRFNPELSIKNTQIFNAKEYQEEAKIIEKELKEYLYDFPYNVKNDIEKTIDFD